MYSLSFEKAAFKSSCVWNAILADPFGPFIPISRLHAKIGMGEKNWIKFEDTYHMIM